MAIIYLTLSDHSCTQQLYSLLKTLLASSYQRPHTRQTIYIYKVYIYHYINLNTSLSL